MPADVDALKVVRLADGGDSSPLSLSRFELPERRKLRPRIDLRPLFSSVAGVEDPL